MALGVRKQRVARRMHRHAEADRGEHVLERAARAQVHVHVSGRDERQAACARERAERFHARRIVSAQQKLGGDPRTLRETGRDEARVIEIGGAVRNEQRKAAVESVVEVGCLDPIRAFGRTHAPFRDQRAHAAVSCAVGCEQHELRPVLDLYFGADDELQPARLRRDMRPHDACDRAFVGDRERRVAERMRAFDQLLRVRCAAQETEVREAMKLGVGGKHGEAVKE